MTITVDVPALDSKVQALYRNVAEQPRGTYHFETGRGLAERLGYPAELLDRVPAGAVESYAGVGYFFDLAALVPGERVIDLGSGSGMDAFVAAHQVRPSGATTVPTPSMRHARDTAPSVVGVDFTPEQLVKARRLAAAGGFGHTEFRYGRIERLPAMDDSFDCAISNGVVNLSAAKAAVFAEVARVLRPGGRLALADIITERPLKDSIVCDVDLWASCIGGAAQRDTYREAIEAAGLRIVRVRENPYRFLSARARDASITYGVKSISLLAVKPGR